MLSISEVDDPFKWPSNTIELEPQEILRQVAASIRGKLSGMVIKTPTWTAWTDALKQFAKELSGQEDHFASFPSRSAAASARIQKLARENMIADPNLLFTGSSADHFPGLRIRNIGDPNVVSQPDHASPAYKAKLKDNALNHFAKESSGQHDQVVLFSLRSAVASARIRNLVEKTTEHYTLMADRVLFIIIRNFAWWFLMNSSCVS